MNFSLTKILGFLARKPDLEPNAPVTKLALKRAGMLLDCYPQSAAQDGSSKTYLAAIALTLSQYSDEVVVLSTDPVKGIASTCKFRPSVAEINACCEKWAQIIWARDHADEISAAEEAERQAKLAAAAEMERLRRRIHEIEHGKPRPELTEEERQANRERYSKILNDTATGGRPQ